MFNDPTLANEKAKLMKSLDPIVNQILAQRTNLVSLIDQLKDFEVDCYIRKKDKCVEEVVNSRLQYEKLRRKHQRDQNDLHSSCLTKYLPAHMRQERREPLRTKEDLECYKRYTDCQRDSYSNLFYAIDKEREMLREMLKSLKQKFNFK